MHVLATEEPLTRLVRIVYDDGSEVECEMTKGLARSIARMARAERRAEQKHRKHCKTATDLGTTAESWWQTRRFVQRHGPKPGVLHLGEGALWSGPAGQWVTEDGRVCVPTTESGFDLRVPKGAKCRFCASYPVFPRNAVCYNGDCTRERKADRNR